MRNLIGLDIGSYSIKLADLKDKGGKFSLVNFGVVDISEEPIESLEPAQKNTLILEAIKKIFNETNVKTKEVGLSLSGEQVIVRYIKLPFMSKEELKGVIKYEAEQYIPFNINQVVMDFSILGEVTEDRQKKIEVLLVAVKEEVVNQYISLLQPIGLSVSLIDIDCFAMQNSLEINYEKKEGETIALINIGAKYTNLNVVEDGVTKFSRDIPLGGISLTKDIQREFNISFSDAEKLKREQGSIIVESEEIVLTRIPSKEDKRVKIFSAISSTLSKMVLEVRRAFDFYESSSKKRSIGRVLLSGGSSKLKNIDKFISERLKSPVDIHNPFTNIEIEDITTFDEKIKQLDVYMPVSVGISTRRVR
ncbi:MAG: type IV pilus assembly protein PilM [Candidatus Firestonebacteria bacterium]